MQRYRDKPVCLLEKLPPGLVHPGGQHAKPVALSAMLQSQHQAATCLVIGHGGTRAFPGGWPRQAGCAEGVAAKVEILGQRTPNALRGAEEVEARPVIGSHQPPLRLTHGDRRPDEIRDPSAKSLCAPPKPVHIAAMPQDLPPRIFDDARLLRNRERAAKHYPDFSFLKVRAADALIERLEDSTRRFPLACDIGCHDGTLARRLAAHEKTDTVVALDRSPAMAARAAGGGVMALAGHEEALPLAEGRFDLAASVLSLHWANDLPGTLIQIRRVLKPDGLFLGALFGAGTLAELRTTLLEAESDVRGGAAARISPLPGLQDMAALMQRTGFALPVCDVDRVIVRYDSPFRLLQDLRGMGERAAFTTDRRAPALSRAVLGRMAELYMDRHADPDGRIRATFELIWLSGWAPAESQPKPLRPGSARASLAEAVGAKERSAGEKAGGGSTGT